VNLLDLALRMDPPDVSILGNEAIFELIMGFSRLQLVKHIDELSTIVRVHAFNDVVLGELLPGSKAPDLAGFFTSPDQFPAGLPGPHAYTSCRRGQLQRFECFGQSRLHQF